jgi:cytochrome c553
MKLAGIQIFLVALLAACSQPAKFPGFDQVTADPIKHGGRLAQVLGCAGCHGADLSGQDWSSADFVTMHTANLTIAAARYSPDQLEAVIRTGRKPGGRELWDMPSHLFTGLSDHDMKPLVAYLKAQPKRGQAHPDPVFYDQARKEMAAGIYKSSAAEARELGAKPAPDAGPGHDQARYMVRATCAECHGVDLRGGVPFPDAPFRPDLRMVSAYSKADFMTLMITGKATGNRELPMMSGVARGRFARLTPAERDSIYAYLVALAKKDP